MVLGLSSWWDQSPFVKITQDLPYWRKSTPVPISWSSHSSESYSRRSFASDSKTKKVKLSLSVFLEIFLELEPRVKPSDIQDKLDLKKAAHFVYLHYALQRKAHIDLIIWLWRRCRNAPPLFLVLPEELGEQWTFDMLGSFWPAEILLEMWNPTKATRLQSASSDLSGQSLALSHLQTKIGKHARLDIRTTSWGCQCRNHCHRRIRKNCRSWGPEKGSVGRICDDLEICSTTCLLALQPTSPSTSHSFVPDDG